MRRVTLQFRQRCAALLMLSLVFLRAPAAAFADGMSAMTEQYYTHFTEYLTGPLGKLILLFAIVGGVIMVLWGGVQYLRHCVVVILSGVILFSVPKIVQWAASTK